MRLSQKKLKKLLRMAVKMSGSCEHRAQHISFLLRKNRIISVGVNKRRTDTFAYKHGYKYPSTHSELQAIKTVRYKPQQARGAILVNIRVLRDSSKNGVVYSLARPCPACLALARSCGVSKIYFTTEKRDFAITT